VLERLQDCGQGSSKPHNGRKGESCRPSVEWLNQVLRGGKKIRLGEGFFLLLRVKKEAVFGGDPEEKENAAREKGTIGTGITLEGKEKRGGGKYSWLLICNLGVDSGPGGPDSTKKEKGT